MANAVASNSSRIRSRTFAALRNRDYRRFYVGQGISLIGTWLQAAAINWIVFDRTHSEFTLGVVGAAGLLPGLAVGLFAGMLADRVVPRRLILVMEIAQMFLAFSLAILVGMGIAQIWQMAAILALTRVCVTFEMPSRQVFMYDLVGREDLANAIALNSSLFNASRVLGPALAGVCYSVLGATACFALNGASFIAAIAALLSIRVDNRRSPQGSASLNEALGGFAYLRRDRRVAALFLLMTLFGVVGMGYDAMIPAYASRVVGTGVRGYSVLLAFSGIGATSGALLVAALGGIRRKELLVLGGLLLFALALAASAWLPPLVGRPTHDPLRLTVASFCLFAVGVGAVIFYAATQTLIQSAVPDHLRGRVMGIWMIAFSGSVPLGSLWTGRLAHDWGVDFAMAVSSLICVLLAILGYLDGLGARKPSADSGLDSEL